MITNHGTQLQIPARQVPDTFVQPPVSGFTDHEYVRSGVLEVDRDTIGNSDKGVTMINLIEDPTIGITKQVTDLITADYDGTTNNVDIWTRITAMDTNAGLIAESDLLTSLPIKFLASVSIFVKTSPV